MCDIHFQVGELDSAIEEFQISLAISKKLVENSPEYSHAFLNLSVAYGKLGTVLLRNQQIDKALDNYRESLEIRKTIVVREPDSNQAKRNLSTAFNKIGEVLLVSGKPKEALTEFERSWRSEGFSRMQIQTTLCCYKTLQHLSNT